MVADADTSGTVGTESWSSHSIVASWISQVVAAGYCTPDDVERLRATLSLPKFQMSDLWRYEMHPLLEEQGVDYRDRKMKTREYAPAAVQDLPSSDLPLNLPEIVRRKSYECYRWLDDGFRADVTVIPYTRLISYHRAGLNVFINYVPSDKPLSAYPPMSEMRKQGIGVAEVSIRPSSEAQQTVFLDELHKRSGVGLSVLRARAGQDGTAAGGRAARSAESTVSHRDRGPSPFRQFNDWWQGFQIYINQGGAVTGCALFLFPLIVPVLLIWWWITLVRQLFWWIGSRESS